MNQLFKNHKKEIFLFLLMLVLGLAMIFVLIQKNDLNIFSRSDGIEYQTLVKNFINHGGFSLDVEAPFIPTNYRTPIYPYWLALIYLIFGSFQPAIFIGAMIFATSAPLAYLIGKQIFAEKIAFMSAIIFAIEPWVLFQSGFLAAEQIFMPIFLLSIYFFCRYLKNEGEKNLYGASLLLGLSALTRPISVLFIPIFIFLIFVFEVKISFWRALKSSFLALVIFIAILSPWLIRNKIILNTWQFSSAANGVIYVESYSLDRYLGKTADNHGYEKASQLLGTDNYGIMKRVDMSNVLADYGIKEIQANAKDFLVMHLKAIPSFLIKNSYGNIFLDLKIENANAQSQIFNLLLQKRFHEVWSFFRDAAIGPKILIAFFFFWPTMVLLSFLGVIVLLRQNWHDLLVWLLIFWMIYFIFIAGNLLDISRYKLAINVPLLMFAVFGFYAIKNYFLTFIPKKD